MAKKAMQTLAWQGNVLGLGKDRIDKRVDEEPTDASPKKQEWWEDGAKTNTEVKPLKHKREGGKKNK